MRADDARAFAEQAPPGAVIADLGAGAGRYTAMLGDKVVALDASSAMLDLLRATAPGALPVLGDLEALPFRDGALGAAWANMSYLHVPRPRLPAALARLHWAMRAGAPYDIQVLRGDQDFGGIADDDIGGRQFAAWAPEPLADVLEGAGFEVDWVAPMDGVVRSRGHRRRSLPDTVAPGMAVLVCGLNPSLYAADRGVGFARRSNRFWRCAVEAGLVSRPFDPLHALLHRGLGMTDLVKRATTRSSEVTAAEYRDGLARVERLVAWLEPRVVCFVGLEGWRAAVDRRAEPGLQDRRIGGRPAYVMPSTSGLNARATPSELAAHLRAVRTLASAAE